MVLVDRCNVMSYSLGKLRGSKGLFESDSDLLKILTESRSWQKGAHLPGGHYWKDVQFHIGWRDGNFKAIRRGQQEINRQRIAEAQLYGPVHAKAAMEEAATEMAAIGAEERRRAALADDTA